MSSVKKERDFRKGCRPTLRTVEAMNAIREALSKGPATFGVILERTGLSRRSLASNLKKMVGMGEVKRWVDEKDRRLRYYALDDLGWGRYRQQVVAQILSKTDLTPLGGVMTSITKCMADASTVVVEIYNSQGCKMPKLTWEEECIFLSCFEGHIYACGKNNEIIPFEKALSQFLAITKTIAQSEKVDLRLLEGLPDLVFKFQIGRDRLIELCKRLNEFCEELKKTTGERILFRDAIQYCRLVREKDIAESHRNAWHSYEHAHSDRNEK